MVGFVDHLVFYESIAIIIIIMIITVVVSIVVAGMPGFICVPQLYSFSLTSSSNPPPPLESIVLSASGTMKHQHEAYMKKIGPRLTVNPLCSED